jgi:hypothetical protein
MLADRSPPSSPTPPSLAISPTTSQKQNLAENESDSLNTPLELSDSRSTTKHFKVSFSVLEDIKTTIDAPPLMRRDGGDQVSVVTAAGRANRARHRSVNLSKSRAIPSNQFNKLEEARYDVCCVRCSLSSYSMIFFFPLLLTESNNHTLTHNSIHRKLSFTRVKRSLSESDLISPHPTLLSTTTPTGTQQPQPYRQTVTTPQDEISLLMTLTYAGANPWVLLQVITQSLLSFSIVSL